MLDPSKWLNWQPYSDPKYFVVLIGALVPLMIGLYYGRRLMWYQTLISFIFLVMIFDGSHFQEGLALIGYTTFQTLLVWGYARYRLRPHSANRTGLFYLAVALAILPLVIVKLTPAFGLGSSFLGFLGISYLTFKSVGLLMELRDGVIKQVSVVRFIQFLLFFPTISSGPIDRYRRWLKDYDQAPTQEKYVELLEKGIKSLFLGFFYKYILGYFFGSLLYPGAEKLALLHQGHPTELFFPLVLVMYSYSFYLFFDFAGYSLFAVGISYLMGIETPINFNKPFIAKNIKDFWNRWHMTLSFWFRDYIYMRFIFFVMKKGWIKNRVTLANTGYFVLFLIMGFWHGVTWYYIVYGLFHATIMVINDAWLRFKKAHPDLLPSNGWTKAFAMFITFNTVCFSFLIFSGFLNTLFFTH